MKKFAQLLNKLYFTYSHLAKTAIIHSFFKTTPDPERGYALAILANTIAFPTFKRSLIMELVQEKIDPILFALSYDYVGDISETTSLIWPEPHPDLDNELPPLSIIIEQFNGLPQKEIKPYLEYLLDRSNAVERWALLKLGAGNLRIGVSARFLKNTLAKYGNIGIQEVEQIWHALQAPYVDLFAWLEKKAPKPVILNPMFFHPVMLSHPLEEQEIEKINWEDFSFERKYDGIRIQVVATESGKALFTRTGDNISHSFPDLLASIEGNVVLDGELIIHLNLEIKRFNELQQRLNRKSVTSKLLAESPAGMIVYDILFEDGSDLRALPFILRRKKLENWVATHPSPNLFLSDLLFLNQDQSVHELKQYILQENHPAVEGLMIKHRQSPYLAGRPKGYWYKWKYSPMLIDAVLMYAQRGHGKRSSYYSDYTFGLWQDGKLLPVGKAYFGFTDEELLELDKWVRHHTIARFGPVREVAKELVFEVAFDAVNVSNRHKSGVALRFPRIHRIRWDKPADEADILDSLRKLIK